jgi:hypothetical protein
VRFQAAILGALASPALAAGGLATPATAQAPIKPEGNFGGGALVAAPRAIDGAGNAIVALRALPKRRLEIEATVRGRCAGGDISAATKVSAGGSFESEGTVSQQPDPALKITTTYKLSGSFTSRGAAEGTLSATLERSLEGKTTTCRSGTVKFSVRRPTGGLGDPGAPKAAFYYGTTAQRSTGPTRPIVLRVSANGRRLSRALFGESVKCSDDRVAIGIEAPRTDVPIDSRGRVADHELYEFTQGEAVVHVDDHFTAELGSRGARGTFSLSSRAADRASGRTIQTCKSGTVRWRAAR